MWLGMLLLAALAIFIVWDSHRLRREPVKPLARERIEGGFAPRGLVAWHFWLGISAVVGLLALTEWDRPSSPPFTGRWAWLHQAAFDLFGSRGTFLLFFAFAVVAFAYGLVLMSREMKRKRSAS